MAERKEGPIIRGLAIEQFGYMNPNGRINDLGEQLASLQIMSAASGFDEADDWIPSLSDSFPWSKLGFGYRIDPDGDNTAEVRINAGEVHHGTRDIIAVGQINKVLTEDLQFLWIEYPLGSGAATIGGPSVAQPQSSAADGIFREWLFQFRLQAGVASLYRIGHMGNIIIPGAFG